MEDIDQSVRTFDKMHMRDELRRMARHVGDETEADSLVTGDIFDNHAAGAGDQTLSMIFIALLVTASLVIAGAWFFG